jgi:RimJ/RimL family protein N-acetyltransferase
MDDARLLWRWACDPETRQNSFNKAAIAFDDHVRWLARQLDTPDTRFWLFDDEGGPVGQVRVTGVDREAEIHISVADDRRGRGHGKAMLRRAIDLVRAQRGEPCRIKASVLEHNGASLRMFRAVGFHPVETRTEPGGERTILLELADR